MERHRARIGTPVRFGHACAADSVDHPKEEIGLYSLSLFAGARIPNDVLHGPADIASVGCCWRILFYEL